MACEYFYVINLCQKKKDWDARQTRICTTKDKVLDLWRWASLPGLNKSLACRSSSGFLLLLISCAPTKISHNLLRERHLKLAISSEHGFALHKGAFRDALCLCYGWRPPNLPSQCVCGKFFTVEHALSCPRGGFPSIRHNEIRDMTATLMSKVCHNVKIEPGLQRTCNWGEIWTQDSQSRGWCSLFGHCRTKLLGKR